MSDELNLAEWFNQVRWDEQGLAPVVAQEAADLEKVIDKAAADSSAVGRGR